MSYALAWPLQRAIYARLLADVALQALLGGAKIYDEAPHGDSPLAVDFPYVILGQDQARLWGDGQKSGLECIVRIDIYGSNPGFAGVKQIAGRVCDLLHHSKLTLDRGLITLCTFIEGSSAKTDDGMLRHNTLQFKVFIEDTI